MGEIETAGPGARELLQRLLSNDVAKIEVGGAQYSLLCREDGGVLDDLFTYRLARRPLPDGHQRRQPRARPRLVSRARRRLRRRGARPRSTTTRCSPSRAREARAIVAELARRRAAAADAHGELARAVGGRRGARLRHRLHGRGRGRDPDRARAAPAALGRAARRAARRPAGLGARDTLRLEVCFHLYGNDLSDDRNPIEAGLGWCCKEETGFIGSEAVAAARADGHRREARALRAHRAAASRARATRCSPAASRSAR